MRTSILGFAACVAVILAVPRHAHACGQGGGSYGALYAVAVAGLVVSAVDAGMFVVDGAHLAARDPMSRGYATFELVWTVPQALLGTAATISILNGPEYNRGTAWGPAIYTATMALMATHAIWTLGIPDSEREEMEARHRPAVGVGATYVDVGQQSKPGLGLVGRF